MQILYLLQECCHLPTAYRFTLYTYGPQGKLWAGTIHQTITAARDDSEPQHDFRDHVTRLVQDHRGADTQELTLRAKLVYANRNCNLDSLSQAVSFIRELSPHIPPENTRDTWQFLIRRGLVRAQEQKPENRENQ